MTLSRSLFRYGGLFALTALVVFIVASGWWRHLTPADLSAHYGRIAALVRQNPIGAVAAFILVSAATTAACLPGIGILVLFGGALFGGFEGGCSALVGSVFGSTCVFLACRSATTRWAGPDADGRVAKLIATLSNHGFSALLVLRLTPVAPLSVVNIAAGVAQVRPAPFIAASLLGSAPSIFIYAAVGSGLRGAFERGAVLDPATLAKPGVVLPLLGLAALAGAAAVVNARRSR